MARLNVEDDLFLDPRFKRLVVRLGSERMAMGLLIEFLFVAQKYWGESRSLIPNEVFDVMDAEVLVEVKLAIREDGGIYAKGAKDHFEWYALKKEAGVVGGQKSAEARRLKFGSAVPKNASNGEKIDTKTEAEPKHSQALPNPPALSLALTPSLNSFSLPPDAEPKKEKVSPRELAELWNEITTEPIKKIVLSTFLPGKPRWKQAQERLDEVPDLAYWRKVIERIESSARCHGKNDRNWKANFQFLIWQETHVKALEGAYDDWGQKPKREIKYIPLIGEESPEGETA